MALYWVKWCIIPEDSNSQHLHSENLTFCMYVFVYCSHLYCLKQTQSEGADHNSETNAAYVDSDLLVAMLFMCLHLALNTAMLYNQHAAKYIWQTTQCMHLSVFLHYWAEVKVNKLSLRTVCPIWRTPGLFPNVLLVICYHPWVRMSRKMGSMEFRWERDTCLTL